MEQKDQDLVQYLEQVAEKAKAGYYCSMRSGCDTRESDSTW